MFAALENYNAGRFIWAVELNHSCVLYKNMSLKAIYKDLEITLYSFNNFEFDSMLMQTVYKLFTI